MVIKHKLPDYEHIAAQVIAHPYPDCNVAMLIEQTPQAMLQFISMHNTDQYVRCRCLTNACKLYTLKVTVNILTFRLS